MDKKNTLLLTVIAIATLLVAVVGATFAYFTAQNGNTVTANMQVTTATTNTATINAFEDFVINANQINFADLSNSEETYVGSQRAETTGSISFSASSAAQAAESYCYTVKLNVEYDTFGYTLPKTFAGGTELHDKYYPELVFNISKAAGDTNPANESPVYDEYTGTALTGDTTVDYYATILDSTKICKNTGNADVNYAVEGTCENGKISGYDITGIGNSSARNGIQLNEKLQAKTSLEIPVYSGNLMGGESNATTTIHRIESSAGASSTDYWKASITFVNYKDSDLYLQDGHESDKANQNANAGQNNAEMKGLKAQLVFTPVDCKAGTPLTGE